MSKIYGYCMEISLKGMGEQKIKMQKDEILKFYPEAEIKTEIVGTETYIRPIFNEIVENCKEGDLIICTRLDRFCRSTKECVKSVDELLEKRAKIHILNMGIIDSSETGKLIYKNILAFNEFQKAVKIDRMNSKKEIYSANKHEINVGRPKKFSTQEIDKAVKLLETYTYAEVAEMTGISKGTLWREKVKKDEIDSNM